MNSMNPAGLLSRMRVRLVGDKDIAGSILAGSRNILSCKVTMKYFPRSFSSFHRFKKHCCQCLAKECAQVLVNGLEDLASLGKVWLGKPTVLDMTLMG